MLEMIFPKTHHRYAALPLLGSLVDDFAVWLSQCDYRPETIRIMLGPIGQVDQWLRSHGSHDLLELDASVLEACWRHFYRRNAAQGRTLGGLIRALARYMEAEGLLQPAHPPPLTPSQRLLATYTDYLLHVRGLTQDTIAEHTRNTLGFRGHLDYDATPAGLGSLSASRVESFVRLRAGRLGRGSQQHLVAHLRSFLRFLATTGQCPSGLDTTIDTPRLYRLEQLPRALPWETVQALLQSIDRRTPIGLRDYTMLVLIATYGLRISEVAALTLDHVHWREGWLQVPRCKTRDVLHLPLTDRVVGPRARIGVRLPCRWSSIAGPNGVAWRSHSTGPIACATPTPCISCTPAPRSKPSEICSGTATTIVPTSICASRLRSYAMWPCLCPPSPPTLSRRSVNHEPTP